MFWITSSMGLPLIYRHYWGSKHTEQRRPRMSPDQVGLEETGYINDAATTLSLRQQWIRTVRMMFVLWKGVIAGCALILAYVHYHPGSKIVKWLLILHDQGCPPDSSRITSIIKKPSRRQRLSLALYLPQRQSCQAVSIFQGR